MGIHRMGPPPELVLALQRRMGLKDFVETGTFHGDTTAWAAEHFSRVITIELSQKFHALAVARFRAEPKVRVLSGNSSTVLRDTLSDFVNPALFWLDAHWSGLDTAGRDAECPLVEEIALINSAACTHTLLVDDARLFCAPPPRPHRADQWPNLSRIVRILEDGSRRHVVLFEDVFIAVPSAEREFLSEWLQNETTAAWAKFGRKSWWKKLCG